MITRATVATALAKLRQLRLELGDQVGQGGGPFLASSGGNPRLEKLLPELVDLILGTVPGIIRGAFPSGTRTSLPAFP